MSHRIIYLALCLLSSTVLAQMAPVTPMEHSILTEGLKGHDVALLDTLPPKLREIRDSFLIDVITSARFKPVGNRLVIRNAVITHDIQYTLPRTPQSLVVPLEVEISNSDFEATFACIGCHFRESLILTGGTFYGGIDINGSDIAGDLSVSGIVAPLTNDGQGRAMNMQNLHVGGRVQFTVAEFQGAVDATHLKATSLLTFLIGRLDQLELTRADIGDATLDLSYSHDIKHHPSIQLRGATTRALEIDLPASTDALDLSSIQSDEITIHRGSDTSSESPPVVQRVTLENATIKTTFAASDIEIESMLARRVNVAGRALLSNVSIKQEVSFESATLGSIEWSARSFPPQRYLDNIKSQHWDISLLHGPVAAAAGARHPTQQQSDATLDFLRKAEFSQAAFMSYEADLKARGATARADEVYFAMRNEGREVNAREGHWPAVLIDGAQQYILGYGRSAIAPLLWSGAFVIFGFFLFRHVHNMEARVEKPGAYTGFWYSLELFLPIVDLGVAKEWRPNATVRLRIIYARVHQLMGWILVPVAIAAVTGIAR